jgi:hypothetical protein
MSRDRGAHSRHADPRRILVERAIHRIYGGCENFRGPVKIRRTLTQVHRVMPPGKIVDPDKNRRAKPRDPL